MWRWCNEAHQNANNTNNKTTFMHHSIFLEKKHHGESESKSYIAVGPIYL